MKTRTQLRAGGSGCSPETKNYMKKALNMQQKLANCLPSQAVYYPTYPTYPTYSVYPAQPYVPPATTTPPSTTGYTYPDMSGYCG